MKMKNWAVHLSRPEQEQVQVQVQV